MLAAHYAPAARVVLAEAAEADTVAQWVEKDTGWRAGGDRYRARKPAGRRGGATVPCFGSDYARVLYQRLRTWTRRNRMVAIPEPAGIGLAVRDRLRASGADLPLGQGFSA